MAIQLSAEQKQAFDAIDRAVKDRDRQGLLDAAKLLKGLTADLPCEQSKKAIQVLAVMGQVGDIDNAPKVFEYLKERVRI